MPATTKKAKKATAKKTAKKAVKKTTKKAAKKAVKKATKKTAKKTVATAGAKKKAVKTAKKPLVVAAGEKAFWTTNGQVLDSLLALRDALEEMEREVYGYHVRPEQNDFALWVGDVLCDAECAAALAEAATPKKAKTVVVRHLKFYAI